MAAHKSPARNTLAGGNRAMKTATSPQAELAEMKQTELKELKAQSSWRAPQVASDDKEALKSKIK